MEEKPGLLCNHADDEKDMFATDDDDDDDDEVQVVEVSKANTTAAADISCIVLDDSTGSNETPTRTSAFIKVPSGRYLLFYLFTYYLAAGRCKRSFTCLIIRDSGFLLRSAAVNNCPL